MSKKETEDKINESNKGINDVNDVLERLLKGEEIFETINTARGVFVMKYPRPYVLRNIQILLAERFPKIDLNNLPLQKIRNSEVYAVLDTVIVTAPTWWTDLGSAEQCPDDELIIQLYRRYLRFYEKIQRSISKSGVGLRTDLKRNNVGDQTKIMDSGTFSGIANG